MRLFSQPVAPFLLLLLACLVVVGLVGRDFQTAALACGWRASALTEARSLRERALGTHLPLQLPVKVSTYIDALQFPESCDQDTPATVWTGWSWGGPGLGAHFIHWSWTFGVSLAMRRTYVARDPDPNFGYNEGRCEHSLFCALHPISSCTEAEVDGRSAASQQVRNQGWVYGLYDVKRPVNLSEVADVRHDPGRIFNSNEYWTEQHGGDPTTSCRATLWVPPQFRTVGTELEWQRLRDRCDYSAFRGIPNGLERASQDLLWWRSMVVGYFFQPLPAVLARARAKVKRIGLAGRGGGCVALHIRRGDKVREGSIASEGHAHPLTEYMELAAEFAEASGSVLYLASDDLSALLKEWDTGGYGAHWHLLVDREELPWSTGFDIGRPKREDEYEESIAAVWALSSCPYMVGSLESYFYKLAMHVGIARGIYRGSHNLYNAKYVLGVMGVPGKTWYNFMP